MGRGTSQKLFKGLSLLRPRIIPCLLLRDGGLVKTCQFGEETYVGDPFNAVRIFNEKGVDELIVADIAATAQNREPNYELIENIAAECRMPLAYGGGVNKLEHVERIIRSGVEKVLVGASAIIDPDFVATAVRKVGSQSVTVVADVRNVGGCYEVFTHNGTRQTGINAAELALKAEQVGAGEFVINSIDRDGTMKGYDLDLIEMCRQITTLPITALGGAGSLDDIASLIEKFPIIGAAAGSLFVFKGKYRAVLINYPDQAAKSRLFVEHPW